MGIPAFKPPQRVVPESILIDRIHHPYSLIFLNLHIVLLQFNDSYRKLCLPGLCPTGTPRRRGKKSLGIDFLTSTPLSKSHTFDLHVRVSFFSSFPLYFQDRTQHASNGGNCDKQNHIGDVIFDGQRDIS